MTGIYLVQRWNGSNWYVASRQNTPMYAIGAGTAGRLPAAALALSGHERAYNRGQFRVQLLVA